MKKPQCPNCKRHNSAKHGTKVYSGGRKLQRHKCNDCGHVFTGQEIRTG